MNMLYDSDSFAVVQIHANAADTDASKTPAAPSTPQLARHGFEIVDKRSGKEVYLDGAWAELFQARLNGWQQKTPTQEEVEAMLESYAELAQMPVVMH